MAFRGVSKKCVLAHTKPLIRGGGDWTAAGVVAEGTFGVVQVVSDDEKMVDGDFSSCSVGQPIAPATKTKWRV